MEDRKVTSCRKQKIGRVNLFPVKQGPEEYWLVFTFKLLYMQLEVRFVAMYYFQKSYYRNKSTDYCIEIKVVNRMIFLKE